MGNLITKLYQRLYILMWLFEDPKTGLSWGNQY